MSASYRPKLNSRLKFGFDRSSPCSCQLYHLFRHLLYRESSAGGQNLKPFFMWNDREEGRRFKLYPQLYLLSGQLLDESLVKDSQTRHDEQECSPLRGSLLSLSWFPQRQPPAGQLVFTWTATLLLFCLYRNSTPELKNSSRFKK